MANVSSSDTERARHSAVWLLVRQLYGPALAALIVASVAALGYVALEDYGWFDAIYMSFITMGTVGFGEVQPLGTGGRIWTIAVIIAGFGLFVYAAALLTSVFVSGEVARVIREQRRSKVRERLQGHVVVVGFGRVGQAATAAVLREQRSCVVVDSNPAAEIAVAASGAVFLLGDARDADVLRLAQVERAAALITALDDPSNAVVTLTARSLAADLRIVSRVGDVSWRDRLMRAGASQVVPVYESVGAGLAATALGSEVLAVLELAGMDMRAEELVVRSGSFAVGRSLRELMAEADNVHLLGLRRDVGLARWHEVEGPMQPGDVLVALGSSAALGRLALLVKSDTLG